MQVRTLSIDEWHKLALEGTELPMRIPINGVSMYPLIRRNRDPVTIMPAKDTIAVGDIVMFADPSRKRYVLHRLWKFEGDRVLTWGDNCYCADGWMPRDRVWGIAVKIERGRKEIIPDRTRGMRHARCMHARLKIVRPVHAFLSRLRRGFKRIIDRKNEL